MHISLLSDNFSSLRIFIIFNMLMLQPSFYTDHVKEHLSFLSKSLFKIMSNLVLEFYFGQVKFQRRMNRQSEVQFFLCVHSA